MLIIKIELGKKPTQKVPSSEDTVEEEYRLLYKEATGKSALYKRNGEWKESKKYKEWRNKELASSISFVSVRIAFAFANKSILIFLV